MKRPIFFGLAVFLIGTVGAWPVSADPGSSAAPAKASILVKILTSDAHVYVGELQSENDDALTILDLRTHHERTIAKTLVLQLDRDLSDDDAVADTDLPTVLGWKLSKLSVNDKPTIGKIARIDEDVIYTTLGADHVNVGSHVTVYRNEGEIKDPDTGKVLGTERPRLGELEITEVQDSFSKAKRLGDIEVKLLPGDEVELAGARLRIAVYPPVNTDGNETPSGTALSERLTTQLVDDKIDVVERSRLSAALTELSIQNTALFDPATAQKFGHQVGATDVLTGQIVAGGSTGSEAHIRLIDVETGTIVLAASTPLAKDRGDSAAAKAPAGDKPHNAGAITHLRAYLPEFLTCNRSLSVVKGGLSLPGGTYIRTKDGGFIDKDFTFDVWFVLDDKNLDALIGIGSGIDGEHATPTNSIYLTVHHNGKIEINDREGYGGTGIGEETDPGTYVARVQKEGPAVTFSVGTEKDGVFTADASRTYVDIQKTPDNFNGHNMHIFFGAGVYTQFRFVAGTPDANH